MEILRSDNNSFWYFFRVSSHILAFCSTVLRRIHPRPGMNNLPVLASARVRSVLYNKRAPSEIQDWCWSSQAGVSRITKPLAITPHLEPKIARSKQKQQQRRRGHSSAFCFSLCCLLTVNSTLS